MSANEHANTIEALAKAMYENANPNLTDAERKYLAPWDTLDELAHTIWTDLANAAHNHLGQRITELEAALEYQKYGGRLLGDMFVKQSKDVVAAVGAEHMIDEDGDGDYGAVFELLFELRPARDAALAKLTSIEMAVDRAERHGSDIETADLRAILEAAHNHLTQAAGAV
ncbi:hypothetical protein B2J88_07945 [Rhodococcus sp. SRB_17]|nr:hypothetical protein [Rhodococcus sp. SRB_17]